MNGKRIWILGGCLVIGMITMGNSAQADTEGNLQARLDRAEARIAELAARQDQQSGNWLSAQRAEEVKVLVQEVLADADMRASMLEGSSAGHNGENFYLSSGDGGFLLVVGGQLQVRHVYGSRDQADDGADTRDEGERGFEVGRANVSLSGHMADPRITYSVKISADRNDNEALVSEAVVGYGLTDNLTVWAGQTKAPFLREELTASSHQLAVERSLVNEVFTLGSVQGIGLDWSVDSGNMLRARVAISDGIRSGESDNDNNAGLHSEDDPGANLVFDADNSDFALTARADLRLMGDWAQGDDFTAGSGEETSVLVGSALHWEVAESGDLSPNNEFVTWTIDGSIECNGANLYAAVVQLNDEQNEGGANQEHTGFVVQAGYQIVPNSLEPFIRYEYLDFDTGVTAGDEELSLITFGLNWYLNSHNAKVTTDIVVALDSMPAAGAMGISARNQSLLGLGADSATEEDQVVWRTQLQLLF